MEFFYQNTEIFDGNKTIQIPILNDKKNAEFIVKTMFDEQKTQANHTPNKPTEEIIRKTTKKRLREFIKLLKNFEANL